MSVAPAPPHPAPPDIFGSVRKQEIEFDQLTRQLEQEHQQAKRELQGYHLESDIDTNSLSSITHTEASTNRPSEQQPYHPAHQFLVQKEDRSRRSPTPYDYVNHNDYHAMNSNHDDFSHRTPVTIDERRPLIPSEPHDREHSSNPYFVSSHPAAPTNPNGDIIPNGGSYYMDKSGFYDNVPQNGYVEEEQPAQYNGQNYDDPWERNYQSQEYPNEFGEGDMQERLQQMNLRETEIENDWRNPTIDELVDLLNHPNEAVQSNAAAYLQHVVYMDEDAKIGARPAIPMLVRLLSSHMPEVQKNSCGALRNLSFGRAQNDNKMAIRHAGGVHALVQLLKSSSKDLQEYASAVLWNLSSCAELKLTILKEAVAVIATRIIIPYAAGASADMSNDKEVTWPAVFRNATGILRNVSSDGAYSRRRLREIDGLINCIIHLLKESTSKADIDNKVVENCVCLLRNLSYRCQEVVDPDFHKKRQPLLNSRSQRGCFGFASSKKPHPPVPYHPTSGSAQGQDLIWDPNIVLIYLPILANGSNPETLEAVVGAIQNLAACDWQPALNLRAAVRKEKGLPIIVALLSIESDRVVSATAAALRNLALDPKNKWLIGKYAHVQLVSKLPASAAEATSSEEAMCAVLATLFEVINKSATFAQDVERDGGIERIMAITRSPNQFSSKLIKFANVVLYSMWQHGELRDSYKKRGFSESDFVSKTIKARGGHTTADNTLYRPKEDSGARPADEGAPEIVSRPHGDIHNHDQYPHNGTHDHRAPYAPPRYHEQAMPDSLPRQDVSMQEYRYAANANDPIYARVNRNRDPYFAAPESQNPQNDSWV